MHTEPRMYPEALLRHKAPSALVCQYQPSEQNRVSKNALRHCHVTSLGLPMPFAPVLPSLQSLKVLITFNLVRNLVYTYPVTVPC